MQLKAEHIDGFSEHLLNWVLVASHGTAIIDASWLDARRRIERTFQMEFPDSRIVFCASVLADLKGLYDGHVDDFPKHELSVTDGSRVLATKVHAGIGWPEEDRAAVESFMRVWRPLYSDVEKLLAIPGRSRKRK